MPVRLILNGPALRQVAITGSDQDLRRRGNRVLTAARAGAPVDEGRLRSSLTMEVTTGPGGVTVVRVGSNLDYAIWVHNGTGIYGPRGAMIRPKRGRFMVWPVKNNSGSGNRRYSGGRTSNYAFAKQTRGVKGRPFLLNALDAAR